MERPNRGERMSNTIRLLRSWVEKQFYSNVEEYIPCQDYETWSIKEIEEEINRMTTSLELFLRENNWRRENEED